MVLKALILVGGYGTRLRPLTFTAPKPMVPFACKPIVMHQVEALVKVGVKEVVLAVSYQSNQLVEYMSVEAKRLGITIHFSKEDEPLGTAGPIALAKKYLQDSEQFFVLNSDVICSFPFADIYKFHLQHKKEGTLFVTEVTDPSKYGVILSKEDGQITDFVEKPQKYVGNKINAGLYIFNSSIIKRIEPKPTSIEREIFPKMAADGELYSYVLKGFWMDVGQPPDYLTGLKLYLDYASKTQEENKEACEGVKFVKGDNIQGLVMYDETVKIGKGCIIGPNVTLGKNVVIGDGVRLENCAILDRSVIKHSAYIRDSIIGWDCTVGSWSRLQNVSVLGEDVTVKDTVMLNSVRVLPHKTVKSDTLETKIIM